MKKILVTEIINDMSFYDIIDGKTPDEVIQEMERLKTRYGEGAHRLHFDVHAYGYDGGLELYFYRERYETDKEWQIRTEHEAKERAKKAEAEKKKLDKEFAEYERLRKKFEGNSI